MQSNPRASDVDQAPSRTDGSNHSVAKPEDGIDLGRFRPAISIELEPGLADPPQLRVARPAPAGKSGESAAPVPLEVRRCRSNSGAVLLFPLWALVHGMRRDAFIWCAGAAAGLLAIHFWPAYGGPIAGVTWVVLPNGGRERLNVAAWRSGRYASAEQFAAVQKVWSRAGMAITTALVFYCLGSFAAMMQASSMGACVAR